jgi:hypothetical protein
VRWNDVLNHGGGVCERRGSRHTDRALGRAEARWGRDRHTADEGPAGETATHVLVGRRRAGPTGASLRRASDGPVARHRHSRRVEGGRQSNRRVTVVMAPTEWYASVVPPGLPSESTDKNLIQA